MSGRICESCKYYTLSSFYEKPCSICNPDGRWPNYYVKSDSTGFGNQRFYEVIEYIRDKFPDLWERGVENDPIKCPNCKDSYYENRRPTNDEWENVMKECRKPTFSGRIQDIPFLHLHCRNCGEDFVCVKELVDGSYIYKPLTCANAE